MEIIMKEIYTPMFVENASVIVRKISYNIYPSIEPSGQKYKHSPRIKVAKKPNSDTNDTSVTSSFPIKNKEIRYGTELNHSDRKKQLDVANGIIHYAYDEFYDLYLDPSQENLNAFENKVKEFSDLDYSDQKKYIKMEAK